MRQWRVTPNDRSALRRYAEDSGFSEPYAKEILCSAGAIEASCDMRGRQFIRIDKQWVKDVTGKKMRAVPSETLVFPRFAMWFRSRAIRSARQGLGLEPLVGTEDLDISDLPSDGGGPLAALIASESSADAISDLAALSEQATPRQAEVLTELLRWISAGHSLEDARRKTATSLNISSSTLRVYLHQLRMTKDA